MPSVRAALLILLAAPVLYPQGVIQTIAGTDLIFPDDGEPALGAALGTPAGLATDAQGNVYIVDRGNSMVFRVDPAGIIRVFAGNGIRAYSGDEGPATSASLNLPFGVAVDSQGNVFISEEVGHRIRKITPDGIIHHFAGRFDGVAPQDGLPALNVDLGLPRGLALDLQGNLYVTAFGPSRVLKVNPLGILTIVAGNGQAGFSGDAGPAPAASLNQPIQSAVGPDGSVYIADSLNSRIRRVAPNGIISTFAGNGLPPGEFGVVTGGPAVSTALYGTLSVIADAGGDVYFGVPNSLLRVDTQGILRFVAPLANDVSDGLARNADGTVYVSEPQFRRVRRVALDGTVTTLAGNGNFHVSAEGTPAREALLFEPQAVATAPDGAVYIADTNNNRVWRIGGDGNLVSVAGNGIDGFPFDGATAKNSPLPQPRRLAFEPNGNLLISAFGVSTALAINGLALIASGIAAAVLVARIRRL